MATNKHAIIRYQTLDKCFRNTGKKYFMEDLIKSCNQAIYDFSGGNDGIKRRQLYEDIKFMESSQGWSIDLTRYKLGKKVYFRYNDPSFSINNSPLNPTEQNLLKEALLTLNRFKGLPHFEWIQELLIRIDSSVGFAANPQHVIEFDQNLYLKGTEYIIPLYNAIMEKQAIEINYKPFHNKDQSTLIISPYYLKQYNGRWFLFGKSKEFEKLTVLPLDRISSLVSSGNPYQKNSDIDFHEYFEDVIGVTIRDGAEVEKIVLQVKSELLPYIETKPIHGSQKVKGIQDGYGIVELNLIVNYELVSLLLSFGDGVTVLQPESLRSLIKMKIKGLNEKYF
ncbi:MAG: WYL domain-containing protein [Ignavibacteria bacterium]|nr:WYL domain-containing protein [Ignavibacteria bacterium]